MLIATGLLGANIVGATIHFFFERPVSSASPPRVALLAAGGKRSLTKWRNEHLARYGSGVPKMRGRPP